MWSILTPRRKVPISTIYLRRHPERSRGILRRYLEAFATGSKWHRDEEFVGQARRLPFNSIVRRERLPYKNARNRGPKRRFRLVVGRATIIALAAAIGIVRGVRGSRRHREN